MPELAPARKAVATLGWVSRAPCPAAGLSGVRVRVLPPPPETATSTLAVAASTATTPPASMTRRNRRSRACWPRFSALRRATRDGAAAAGSGSASAAGAGRGRGRGRSGSDAAVTPGSLVVVGHARLAVRVGLAGGLRAPAGGFDLGVGRGGHG